MGLNTLIFDIETGPAPDTFLDIICPEFTPPANYKDPAKIKEHIEGQKQEWKEKAALSPVTGQVLAIGLDGWTKDILDSEEEQDIISHFWEFYEDSNILVGFNIKHFDLPFLIRRCWKLGVEYPGDIWDGRYWDRKIVDLMDIWCLGERQDRISLDMVSKFLGLGAKSGSGGDFAKIWSEDRAKAREYLLNDLRLTKALAEKLGVKV